MNWSVLEREEKRSSWFLAVYTSITRGMVPSSGTKAVPNIGDGCFNPFWTAATQFQTPKFSLLIVILDSSPFTIWLTSCWAFRETTGQIPRSHPQDRSICHCKIINWQPWFRNLYNMHLVPRKLTQQVSKLTMSRVHTAKTIETSLKQHTCLVFPFWERVSSPLFKKLLYRSPCTTSVALT